VCVADGNRVNGSPDALVAEHGREAAFYVANSHPHPDLDAELERVEGGYGLTAARPPDAEVRRHG